ncbi:hypothetical protein [Streptomyces rochei]|uniref:hypothetical protein n=1 Tax=Streptomyces rochei TaxID=1928 RepID=UPI002948FAFC|nr:hypothetical protein [Streptomyces sp. UP1A-1]
MRWAAATALVRLPGLDDALVGPDLLGRAVTELTAAAHSTFDHVTDYLEGDLHGHIERTLHALPPTSEPAAAREAREGASGTAGALSSTESRLRFRRDEAALGEPGEESTRVRLSRPPSNIR